MFNPGFTWEDLGTQKMYDLQDAGQPTSNKVLLNSLGLNSKLAPKHGGPGDI